jgi:hypothetical protein
MSSNLKPLITGAVIVALDKYALNQQNLNTSLYFGLAGAIGIFGAQIVTPMIPKQGTGTMIDPRTLEGRILEVGLGAGATYGINRFVLNNDLRPNELMMKVAVIAGADFIAEYVDDYLAGRPLSFLQ